MELTVEDIKSTLIRLQGQIDVWQNLYAEAMKREGAKRADDAPKA